MFRFACRMLGNSEDARDTVQDALLKIWGQKEHLKNIKNPEAWCMQIIKNLCLDRHKSKKVRTEAAKDIKEIQNGNAVTPYQYAERRDNMDKVKKAIDGLPEKFRMVIHLREVEEFSYKEISEVLNWSVDEVKINLFRARKLLKDQFVKNKLYGLL